MTLALFTSVAFARDSYNFFGRVARSGEDDPATACASQTDCASCMTYTTASGETPCMMQQGRCIFGESADYTLSFDSFVFQASDCPDCESMGDDCQGCMAFGDGTRCIMQQGTCVVGDTADFTLSMDDFVFAPEQCPDCADFGSDCEGCMDFAEGTRCIMQSGTCVVGSTADYTLPMSAFVFDKAECAVKEPAKPTGPGRGPAKGPGPRGARAIEVSHAQCPFECNFMGMPGACCEDKCVEEKSLLEIKAACLTSRRAREMVVASTERCPADCGFMNLAEPCCTNKCKEGVGLFTVKAECGYADKAAREMVVASTDMCPTDCGYFASMGMDQACCVEKCQEGESLMTVKAECMFGKQARWTGFSGYKTAREMVVASTAACGSDCAYMVSLGMMAAGPCCEEKCIEGKPLHTVKAECGAARAARGYSSSRADRIARALNELEAALRN